MKEEKINIMGRIEKVLVSRKSRKSGITLISLVLTIIVLLILAGISIAMLTGDNGILNKATQAKEQTEIAQEKEAIQLNTIQKETNKEDAKYNIGEELFDRTIENGDKWKVVTETNSKEVYGTGWTFIDKNVDVKDYGKTKYAWVVNENTGEVKQLQDNNYVKLAYGENLAVKDSIILNVDPINMADSNAWGEGVTLYGVQEGDDYGYNGSELKLDGVDDYIEIYTGAADMEKGITFEFYGKILSTSMNSLLCKTVRKPNAGWENYAGRFRIQIGGETARTLGICMGSGDSMSPWKVNETNNKHWINKKFNTNTSSEDYLTITANLENDTISIYCNGEYIDETSASHEWMTNGGLTDSTIPFIIGLYVGGINESYGEEFAQEDIYACRLYNKVLTAEEIKENYNKTVAYHNLLVNEN